MVIQPEVIVTPDRPTVKIREPKEKVDLEEVIPRILFTQGWDCGTIFTIQFISHDRTKLLSMADFVVSMAKEENQTNESNPHQPITRTFTNRKADILGKWRVFEEEKEETGVIVKWNPGKQVHQVISGSNILFESKDKSEALKVANG